MSRLFLFTGIYPYSKYTECFLEDEIIYLSKTFEQIIIVPSRGRGKIRSIPDNCIVKDVVYKSKLSFLFNGLFSCRSVKLLFHEFIEGKVFKSRLRFLSWMKCYFVVNNYLNSSTIKSIEKSIQPEDVCYYYWGKWSNVLSIFFNGKCKNVSRFHGAWDLWEEEYDNYVPLRKVVTRNLDLAVFISKKGELYFSNRYSGTQSLISRLGSNDYGVINSGRSPIINIVSCSAVYPLKRVDLIFRSINHFCKNYPTLNVQWTHMGSGPSFDNLLKEVESTQSENLKVMLLGEVNHNTVIKYYTTNKFDIFINLSTNEGIPVSIMEAISFNISVIGTNVGGNPEIVTKETGILVSSNPSEVEVSDSIKMLLNKDLAPRDFWNKQYNADKNYSTFAKILLNMTRITNN